MRCCCQGSAWKLSGPCSRSECRAAWRSSLPRPQRQALLRFQQALVASAAEPGLGMAWEYVPGHALACMNFCSTDVAWLHGAAVFQGLRGRPCLMLCKPFLHQAAEQWSWHGLDVFAWLGHALACIILSSRP